MRREYQPRNAHTATVLPGPTSPRRVNPSGDAHLAAAFPPGTGVTGPGQHQRLDPSLRALEPGGQAPVASRRAQIATLSRIVARARQQRRPVLRAHAAGLSVPQDPTRRRAARGAPGACIPARKDDERGEQVARVHGLVSASAVRGNGNTCVHSYIRWYSFVHTAAAQDVPVLECLRPTRLDLGIHDEREPRPGGLRSEPRRAAATLSLCQARPL